MCRSGGIQGGLSNGEPIIVRVAFKPVSTIARKQSTVSRDGSDTELLARGRHDPCVLPRAVPMVEAMVALVLADQLLQVQPLAWLHASVCQASGSLQKCKMRQPTSIVLHTMTKCYAYLSGYCRPTFWWVCALLLVTHQDALRQQVCASNHVETAAVLVQHYAQCELLPRGDAVSPDLRAAMQFKGRQQQQQQQAFQQILEPAAVH